MAGNIQIGCAVWVCREWLGTVYPKGTPERDFLRWYGQRLPTVESNATFYALPTAATLAKWREQTPAHFRFWVKVPQAISHRGELQRQVAAAQMLVERLGVLGDRPGGIFLQLPPGYGPDRFSDLQTFGASNIPWPCPVAVEVRHRQWFGTAVGDRLDAWLQNRGMSRVILDSRPIYDGEAVPQLRPKPRLPLHVAVTAETIVVRYVSHPDGDRNQPYLAAWAQQLQTWHQQQKQAYFFVHCPMEERSPANAQRLQTLLQALGLDGGLRLETMPELLGPPPIAQGTQLSLF
ncbi:MAG TPA: DUF72 domain-containing protein [Cyanobacteria bacterium UBA8156]|nr:DUF72 domain-containing protein [Cyanobacteria bacterium UBA8156]